MDQPETLVEYIKMVVWIDNRLYERRQQKRQEKTGAGKQTTIYGKESKKMTSRSTATGTHAGPMDIDAAQKAKTELVCYHCGQKGHNRKTRKAPKNPWKQAPKNGSAIVEAEEAAETHAVERAEST